MQYLEVYHKASDSNAFAHYSYHWQYDRDYIDMIIPADLVERFGAEAFGSVSPAVVAYRFLFDISSVF